MKQITNKESLGAFRTVFQVKYQEEIFQAIEEWKEQ